MKKLLFLSLLVCCGWSVGQAQNRAHQHGTIVRMRMAPCQASSRGWMAALSGSPQPQPTDELCPEYVLVSDKVVYVIVGKTSGVLVPLAETTDFRIRNNELLIRVDDANRETRFAMREMILRSEWDRVHPNLLEDSSAPPRHRLEVTLDRDATQ